MATTKLLVKGTYFKNVTGDDTLGGGTTTSWTGTKLTLQPKDQAQFQTTNGAIIITYRNTDEKNNGGQLMIVNGGKLDTYTARAGYQAPNVILKDYKGNMISITNTSKQATIDIQAWAPDFGSPTKLVEGTETDLAAGAAVYTDTPATYAQLIMSATFNYTVFGVFAGDEPSVYCVNTPDGTKVPAEDYTTTTPDNDEILTKNWLGARIYVVNLSSYTADDANVTFLKL